VRPGEVQVALRARESHYPPRLPVRSASSLPVVPGGGGLGGWGPGLLFTVLQVPQGASAVLAEHGPDGAQRGTNARSQAKGLFGSPKDSNVKTCEPQGWPGVLGLGLRS